MKRGPAVSGKGSLMDLNPLLLVSTCILHVVIELSNPKSTTELNIVQGYFELGSGVCEYDFASKYKSDH